MKRKLEEKKKLKRGTYYTTYEVLKNARTFQVPLSSKGIIFCKYINKENKRNLLPFHFTGKTNNFKLF